MKIEQVPSQLALYRIKKSSNTDSQVSELTTGIRRFADTLQFSETSSILSSARPFARAAAEELDSEVASKVAELKEKVASGTYHVSSDELAEALTSVLL